MSTYCAEAQSGAKLPKERLLETLDFIFQRILPEQGYRLRHEQLALAQDIFTALERRSVLLSEAGVTADSDSWSPVSIAKKIFGSTGYNQGIMFDEIPDVYNTIYEITTSTEGGQLSYSSIISNINGDTPMHTSWQSPDYGHSMGLVGYGNNEEICVNDTNIGDYRWLQKNVSAGDWFYNYGQTYTWDDTIVP